MNLVVIHYHLNRGGVTRVIENQLAALDTALDPAEPWRVALLFGGRREGWNTRLPETLRNIRLTLHEVEGLDYDEQRRPATAGEATGDPAASSPSSALFESITGVLKGLDFAPQQTLIHAHNHNLARSTALPPTLARLAGDGYAMLLQAHDFIEDYRPDHYARVAEAARRNPERVLGRTQNRGWLAAERSEAPGKIYWGTASLCPSHPTAQCPSHPTAKIDCNLDLALALYPQAPHIHYAALNGRDHDVLLGAGVAKDRLHLLPNPVPEMADLPPRSDARRRFAERFDLGEDQRLVLYPVRGIRRKNLGELLLHAAVAPAGYVFALTLPPLNQAEVPIYEAWKDLAAELRLPCLFEVGAPGGLTFAENLAAADLIVTTSLAEGFGMVFLESWLAGCPLFGRDLPEITRDFVEVGLRLDGLHAELRVPLDFIGKGRFRSRIVATYRRTLRTYGRDVAAGDLDGQIDARTTGGTVDFGDLDEELQQEVIRRVVGSGADRDRVLQCNAWIMEVLATVGSGPGLDPTGLHNTIQDNVRAIRERFSRIPSGERLLRLYGQVLASPRGRRPCPLASAERILDAFLDFGRFRPIRS